MGETQQMLGRFEILGELGRGGFATVYRARDTFLGREVALKVLHSWLLGDPGFVKRFQNDARAAAQLEHPHIVTIWEAGQAQGQLYIAMQLLTGGSLAERIDRRGPLPFAEAVRIIGEIAEALDYAHGRGYLHRDVKPGNVLFNARGDAILTDFGLVKSVQSSATARLATMGIIGTAAYIPPEVWRGQPATKASDVYALGCVLYEMLTGEMLFQGDSTPAVMMAHFQPRELPEVWPEGVPGGVRGLLERAVAVEAGARLQSAGELARGLAALAGEVPLRPVVAPAGDAGRAVAQMPALPAERPQDGGETLLDWRQAG